MNLFLTLANYQKDVNISSIEEYYFYLQNRHLLANMEMYRFLLESSDDFDIIRANIIIKAIKNKKAIEEAILYAYKESKMNSNGATRYVNDSLEELPYLEEGTNKIYVPIFSRAINSFYSSKYAKLLKEPYAKLINKFKSSCVDLFEVYNIKLYESLFTRLVTIYKQDDVIAMYHFDFKTMYIINSQGRCDAKIPIFDKYLKNPSSDHIVNRLKAVAIKYIEDDKEGFLDALKDNKLISEKLIAKIRHDDVKLKQSIERKIK